ncbi:MAG: hypothetical protein AAF911_06265 [Planctomycetota bacterium]
MPEERYPTDAELLAITQDPTTGVDYIPTGRSPYILDYRRSLHRTLRAAERANDLRVYLDGDLTVGVRPGRCFIGESPVVFAGQTGLGVQASATTSLWLDANGQVQSATDGLPTDRATFIPLAEVVADSSGITALIDLRGEAFLQAPNVAILGLTATASEINQALDGIASSVTPVALNKLTAGPLDAGDVFHTHINLIQEIAGEARFTLANDSTDASADVSLHFSLPERLPFDTVLKPSADHHFLQQNYGSTTHTLVGSTHLTYTHAGDLTASINDQPLGPAPLDGQVVAVVLSIAQNLQSSISTDGLSVALKVNGVVVTDTSAQLTDADGTGFKCTDQGDGVSAVIKTDGSASVSRGDLLSIDLTRSVSGAVTAEPRDVSVLVVVRAERPE